MLLGRWEIWAGWRELPSPAEEDVLTDPLPEKEERWKCGLGQFIMGVRSCILDTGSRQDIVLSLCIGGLGPVSAPLRAHLVIWI